MHGILLVVTMFLPVLDTPLFRVITTTTSLHLHLHLQLRTRARTRHE